MLMRDRTLAPAGTLPRPAPLPSLPAALSRRAAVFGAVASTGALAGSAARSVAPRTYGGMPMTADAASPPVGPLTLAQAEAVDFAAVWASLSPEAQARIGTLAIEAEAFDQIAEDGGFHSTAEDRDTAQGWADNAREKMRSAIWDALPVTLPTVHDEPYPLWQVLGDRRELPAEVDVRGLGPCALVAGRYDEWFARDGERLVELGGAVDLDSRDEGKPPRWLFWTVADIDAERLRRHPEMMTRGANT